MLKKYFVGDMCAPYRKKITPNQDRVGRVQRFSYGGDWRELRVSMEFETVAIATPCFLAKGCSWGSLFHFYSILGLMRSEIYARFRARIFSWPWFANEKTMGNYPCDPCNRDDTNSPEKILSSAVVRKNVILYKISCITLESTRDFNVWNSFIRFL